MTNDEIDPLVPEMPRRTSTEPVRTDGGRPSRPDPDDAGDAEAPLVPEF